jgi:hypothetical protein
VNGIGGTAKFGGAQAGGAACRFVLVAEFLTAPRPKRRESRSRLGESRSDRGLRTHGRMNHMQRRFLACLLAVVFVAMGQQSVTVQQLITLVKSQQKLIKEKKGTDQELAKYLAGVRLTERLEVSVIEDLQADGAGPQTVKALLALQEKSKGLKAAAIVKALPDEPLKIPTSEEQARILDQVREYVMNYDNSLPDFICMEVEQRMVATSYSNRGSEPSFRPMDTITSKLTYFNHQEKKEPILNGSKPVTGDYESLGGATSRGDFETALRMLFDPHTEAQFDWARWTTWRGRLTMVFGFKVSQSRSQYRIGLGDKKVERITAYSGEVFVDADSPHPVMRLLTKAEEIPADFPIQRAESTLEYKYADIGGQKFLLPFNGEVLMKGPDGLSKNENRFDFYRKYEVGSSISFGDIPKDFSAADDKESAPVKPDCKDPKNKDAPACKKQ